MANFVQEKSLELVTVWKVIRANKILDEEELRNKIAMLRKLEEDFQRQGRDLSDLKKLIDFLVLLVNQLEAGLKVIHVANKGAIRKVIRDSFMSVVGSRFEVGRRHFHTDMAFWRYWVNTYLELRRFESVEDVYKKAVGSLGQVNADIWIETSMYFIRFKRTKGIGDCRRNFQECLRNKAHQYNLNVYVAWYKIELGYRKMLMLELQASPDKGTGEVVDLAPTLARSFALLNTVFRCGKECVGNNPEYYIKLLKLHTEDANKIDETEHMMNLIKHDLEQNCPNSYETYEFLALMNIDSSFGGDPDDQENIARCFAIFHKGTTLVDEKNRPTLYKRFIAAHFRILEHIGINYPLRHIVFDNLKTVYAEAHVLDYLSLTDYNSWIEAVRCLGSDGQKKSGWKEYIQYSEEQVDELLRIEEDAEPLEKRQRSTAPEESEDGDEMDEGNSYIVNMEEETSGLAEVIDLAIKKFPNDPSFIQQKLHLLLGNPSASASEFYSDLDVGQTIVTFLEEYGKVKMTEAEEYPIWRDAFARLILMETWTSSKVPIIIKMAGGKPTIQRRLAKEYLTVLYSEELDTDDRTQKLMKFLKKLAKSNGKPPEWVDEEIKEFLNKMDILFPSASAFGYDGTESWPGGTGNPEEFVTPGPQFPIQGQGLRPMPSAFVPFGFDSPFPGAQGQPGQSQSRPGQRQYGPTAGQAQFGSPAGQAQFGSPAGQAQYGPTAGQSGQGQSQYGPTAGQAQYGSTAAQAQYGPLADQGQYGPAAGQSGQGQPGQSQSRPGQRQYGPTAGQAQFGSPAGQAQFGSPAGQAQYGPTAGQSGQGQGQAVPGQAQYGPTAAQAQYGPTAAQAQYGPLADQGQYGPAAGQSGQGQAGQGQGLSYPQPYRGQFPYPLTQPARGRRHPFVPARRPQNPFGSSTSGSDSD